MEKRLTGASKFLTFGWPAAFGSVAKAVADANFAKALKEHARLQDQVGAEAAHADITTMITSRVARMTAALEQGDFLGVFEVADALDGQLKGLFQDAEVQEVLARLKADPSAKQGMKAQVSLRKLMDSKMTKRKDPALGATPKFRH